LLEQLSLPFRWQLKLRQRGFHDIDLFGSLIAIELGSGACEIGGMLDLRSERADRHADGGLLGFGSLKKILDSTPIFIP
jgi:hypothetical protein